MNTVALKPTIYKLRIALSDLNRDYYDNLNLTVAQHPSENLERLMARVLAFCLNCTENLAFTRGLSSVEEPDIWERTLDEKVALWIEVGEPAVDRVKKASRLADAVKIYSFNSKSDVWWSQGQQKFAALPVSIYRFDWPSIQALAGRVQRTMDLSVTLSGDTAYIASDEGQCEVTWTALQTIN